MAFWIATKIENGLHEARIKKSLDAIFFLWPRIREQNSTHTFCGFPIGVPVCIHIQQLMFTCVCVYSLEVYVEDLTTTKPAELQMSLRLTLELVCSQLGWSTGSNLHILALS